MKTFYTFFFLLISSYMSYAQSIGNVYANETRRNESVWIDIEGLNTHFSESSTLTVSLKSNVDGSVIDLDYVEAFFDDYCYATGTIPATATPGKYAVSVITTNEGKLTKTNAFTVSSLPPVPEPISVTPNIAANGEHVRINIKARYAQFLTASNLLVYVSGNTTYLTADSIIALNDTVLSATLDIPIKNRSDVCGVMVYSNIDNIYFPQSFTISGIDPEIVSITPDSANDGDQLDVTITTTKTGFMSASSVDVMLQGGWAYINASAVTKINDTVLVASFDIPEKTRTSICDVIISEDGNETRATGVFTINGINPQILAISPDSGTQGETLDVTITGQDLFFMGASDISVSLGGGVVNGTSVVVLNDNQIKATIKLNAGTPSGWGYGVIVNVDEKAFALYEAFTVVDDGIPDPQLVSMSPKEAERGQLLDITITGERTIFTQASNIRVFLSGDGYFEPLSTVALSDTKLKCTFSFPSNAQLGLYSVYVYDANNANYLTLFNGFTLREDGTSYPHLVSITPAASFPGQVLDVTITGANTHFMATSTTMNLAIFSQATYLLASSFTATSNTTMIARFEIPEDFPLGVYDFGIQSAVDGLLELLQSVIINAVGLDETEKLIEKLYPNPASNKLYIDTKRPINNFTVIDITGKQIAIEKNDIEQNNNKYTIQIDKLGLRKGIYFIRLESSDGFDYQKFVVE